MNEDEDMNDQPTGMTAVIAFVVTLLVALFLMLWCPSQQWFIDLVWKISPYW